MAEVETVQQAIELFANVGFASRDLSARSREEYRRDLEDLAAFLEDRGVTGIESVSLQHLQAYQAEMDRRGYAASTRERKTYAIKTCFGFLHENGLTEADLGERLVPPKRPKREPRFLSAQEYKRMLRACSHNARDAAIIELFLQTGMRLAELCRLTVDDVELPARINRDPENVGTVHLTRKGGSQDTIPLNYKACKAVKAWLAVRPDVDHDSLFVSKFETPLSRRAIQTAVKKHLSEADIKGASVHTLRHTHATHHALKGTDLRTIQDTLGHADLSTTAMYLQLAKKAQRKALQEHAL